MIKPSQPPWRAGEKRHPLWWLRHHLYPKGSMSLDFRVALLPYIHCCHRLTGFSGRFRSLTNPVRWCNSSSFATPPAKFGGATKGKRPYGQARRLTSPDLHILCRMCTVPLWVLIIVPHDSEGKCREVLFSPP